MLSVAAAASPAGLGRLTDGALFRYPPHLRLLNDALMDVANGCCHRLAIFMPPRHVKSTMSSRNFPAWYCARFPDRRVLLASYEAEFAASWGGKARALIEAYGDSVFGVGVEGRFQARNAWQLTNGSEMRTSGVGGHLTGLGANVLIIDDPVKNAQEALSETYRERAWEWYQSTAYTRLEPGGSIILIMTRWHEDDLAGRILASTVEGEDWRILSFPAVAEGHDILGRSPGDPLWPERYGVADLARIKEAVGTYWWEALYQQRPSALEGNIVKREWWQFWRHEGLPALDELLQSWDMTFTETSDGSFVVGQVWGKHGADRYLLDQTRARMEFTAALDVVRALTDKWPNAHVKLVENKANGPAVMSVLRREMPGLIAVQPEGSKVARARAVTPQIESGNVYLPDPSMPGYGWVRDFISEWSAFPRGVNDDQVDAATQALRRWAGAGSISTGWVAR